MTEAQPQETFYEAIGGRATIELIVDVFYQGVAQDEVLKPMYPEEDLGPAAQRLTMFLEQYWGGPNDYSQQRGHPRLRMRHANYVVNTDSRDRWLRHFRAGLDAAQLEPELDAQFWAYVQHAANFMINSQD
ncbi:globin [Aeromicrobium sp.]|uniref:globin n=1 Tax=Aeromicrobium sp. TaxID=1871063 RepID=UPI0028ACE924|nr:globin [Aeromicrobium sp.]